MTKFRKPNNIGRRVPKKINPWKSTNLVKPAIPFNLTHPNRWPVSVDPTCISGEWVNFSVAHIKNEKIVREIHNFFYFFFFFIKNIISKILYLYYIAGNVSSLNWWWLHWLVSSYSLCVRAKNYTVIHNLWPKQ